MYFAIRGKSTAGVICQSVNPIGSISQVTRMINLG